MPPQTIYVAMDFSPAAERAFEVALDLARQRGAELVIGHVIPKPAVIGHGAIDSRIREEARLERLRRAAEQAGVPARAEILDGSPADALAEAAERAGATMMAVGTRGSGVLTAMALGSVAARLVCTAPCPVLTVRGGAAEEER
jgi:nucleotide-binding universal stress UspA family protein